MTSPDKFLERLHAAGRRARRLSDRIRSEILQAVAEQTGETSMAVEPEPATPKPATPEPAPGTPATPPADEKLEPN